MKKLAKPQSSVARDIRLGRISRSAAAANAATIKPPEPSPARAARPLFVGSGYQFARKTLEEIAEGRQVPADEKQFTQRFLANSLLMVTHYAWAGNGCGVGPFAHLVSHNPPLKEELTKLMPFKRSEIPDRIKAHWPGQVAALFNEMAPSENQQRKLRSLASGHRTRGESYDAILTYLSIGEAHERKYMWNVLMMQRFGLVDNLIPVPELNQANAKVIFEAWKASKVPSTGLRDEMGVPYFHLRFESDMGKPNPRAGLR